MKVTKQPKVVIFFSVFLIVLTENAHALSKYIDDFTTGQYRSPIYRTGINGTAYGAQSSQNGSMLGGNRTTGITVCRPGECGYKQPVSYEFKRIISQGNTSGAFLFDNGFGAGARIDMSYGFGSNPMNVDFTPYDRIRVVFKGLSQYLNFNIQVFTGTFWAQSGCNIQNYGAAFTADFPFAAFSISDSRFSWSNVNHMDFIFQNGSAIGSVNFAISSIQLVDSTEPVIAPDFICQ